MNNALEKKRREKIKKDIINCKICKTFILKAPFRNCY